LTVETHDLGFKLAERFGYRSAAECTTLFSADMQDGPDDRKIDEPNPFSGRSFMEPTGVQPS
jgi:hypothetical protein